MVHILPGRPTGKPDQMSPIRAAVPTGTGLDRVNVRVRSILSFTPHAQGSPKKRAQADQIRTVTVGSPSPMVYYVPMSGNAGLGNGYWVKTTTMQITSPGHGTVGSKTVSEKKNIVRR